MEDLTPAEPIPEVQPEMEKEESAFEWWMVAVALGVFLVGSLLVLALTGRKRRVMHP